MGLKNWWSDVRIEPKEDNLFAKQPLTIYPSTLSGSRTGICIRKGGQERFKQNARSLLPEPLHGLHHLEAELFAERKSDDLDGERHSFRVGGGLADDLQERIVA